MSFDHTETSLNLEKSVLGLQLPTDPRWVDLAALSLQAILSDHAYCEQKAASACISLIVMYNDKTVLVEKLSPIVSEEWGHFRMVLLEMKKRGIKLDKQRKDEYVNSLMKFIRKGVGDKQLLDRLLICALIEARSCERFKHLSTGLKDKELQHFYHSLMVAEAGHYKLFIDLAEEYFDKSEVKERWDDLLIKEANIMHELELRGDRIH